MKTKKVLNKYLSLSISAMLITSINSYADDSLFDKNQIENIQVSEDTTTISNQSPEIIKTSQSKVIKLKLGDKYADLNGTKIELPYPVESINGRTYLPLRFLAENILESKVQYTKDNGKIQISNDNSNVILFIGKKEIIVNQETKTMENSPLVKNNITLLPLYVFPKYFDITIDYNPSTKEVTVKQLEKDINIPIANIELTQKEIIQGQSLNYINKSFDVDGDSIIKTEFKIKDENFISDNINKVLESKQPGVYTIEYRVLNDKKMYSEWNNLTVELKKNEAPRITSMTSNSSSLARGERFSINYKFTNESWENIEQEIWSYRHENQKTSNQISGKPNKFFTAGKYFVTLKLKDSFGNISEPYDIEINISNNSVQTQLEYFASGESLTNTMLENFFNKNYLEYFKPIDKISSITDKPGLLVMSDSPENVYEHGILYEDTIVNTDSGRILTYHVNKINKPNSSRSGVVVIVENLENSPITFSLEDTGIKGPSTSPHEVGGKVLQTHFERKSPWKSFNIPAKKSIIVSDSRKTINWKNDTLISMLSEFKTSGSIKITVASFSYNDTVESLKNMTYLQRDQHPRGTFGIVERAMNFDIPSQIPSYILIGKFDNEWVRGTDGITNVQTINKGNYGVEYKLTVMPREDVLVFLNCRGGAFRGFIGWNDGLNRPISSFGPLDARYVGQLKKGEETTMRYMLANGSASPVLIGFIPKSQWNK